MSIIHDRNYNSDDKKKLELREKEREKRTLRLRRSYELWEYIREKTKHPAMPKYIPRMSDDIVRPAFVNNIEVLCSIEERHERHIGFSNAGEMPGHWMDSIKSYEQYSPANKKRGTIRKRKEKTKMYQKAIFMQGEALNWWNRNKGKYDPKTDPVLTMLDKTGLEFQEVLEIGCSNGYRLSAMKKKYKCHCVGVDPIAKDPVSVLVDDGIDIWKSGADHLPFAPECVDLVIFGFCLYVCDPCDYFKIATEADRVLRPGGKIIIYDFKPPAPFDLYRVPYEHQAGIYSYHYPWESLWLWHPDYSMYCYSKELPEPYQDNYVAILKKDKIGRWYDAPPEPPIDEL